MTTQEKFDRLPKWAQSKIRNLESAVETLGRERDLALGAVDPLISDTTLIDHISGHTALPPFSQIRFALPWNGWSQEAWIEAMISGREGGRPFLEVRAGRGIRIEPRSSNTIWVYALTPLDDEEER